MNGKIWNSFNRVGIDPRVGNIVTQPHQKLKPRGAMPTRLNDDKSPFGDCSSHTWLCEQSLMLASTLPQR